MSAGEEGRIDATVAIIGIAVHTADPHVELRYRRIAGRWEPDLVVNRDEGTVDPPPACFAPNDASINALNEALREAAGDAVIDAAQQSAPLGMKVGVSQRLVDWFDGSDSIGTWVR